MTTRAEHLADRLARALILSVGGVWLACVVAVTWYVDREINRNFDNEQIESAHRMIDIAVHDLDQEQKRGEALAYPLLARQPVIDENPVVFQLVNGGHGLLMRSAQAPDREFPVPDAGGFFETGPWRVYTVVHPVRPVRLHLADPISERRDARNHTLLGLAVPLVATMPLLAWLLRRVARRELRVLHDMEAEIAERGGADLAPIGLDGMPLELQSLGEHVNRLLGRLDTALDAERALAANAAHELRTPLAAARLQLQTALDTDLSRGAIEAALVSLETLRHRAEKLLQLSRAESSGTLASVPVDLAALAATVVDEFAGLRAGSRARLTLDIDPAARGTPCRGDLDSLAIALRNLIENALRHAATEVHVALEPPCCLVVRDDGAGVAPERLRRLAERHVRESADVAGYGLGLSIARSIVDRQGGRLGLVSPPTGRATGFEARMECAPDRGPEPREAVRHEAVRVASLHPRRSGATPGR